MAFQKVMIAGKETEVRVCDHCRTTCIPHGRYCSSRCYRKHQELIRDAADSLVSALQNASRCGFHDERRVRCVLTADHDGNCQF